jgi:hypothetical protein
MPVEEIPGHWSVHRVVRFGSIIAIVVGALAVSLTCLAFWIAGHWPAQATDDDQPAPPGKHLFGRLESDDGARAARVGIEATANPFHHDDDRAAAWLHGYIGAAEQSDHRGMGSAVESQNLTVPTPAEKKK